MLFSGGILGVSVVCQVLLSYLSSLGLLLSLLYVSAFLALILLHFFLTSPVFLRIMGAILIYHSISLEAAGVSSGRFAVSIDMF